jgi:hypothetical protein
MAASPEYTSQPISASATVSAANANLDGATGTYATIYTFTAASSRGRGGRIDAITIQAIGTTTAGMVRMFVGAAMVREFAVTAITPSATVKAWCVPTTDGADVNGRVALDMVCAAGDIIKFSTANGESFKVRVEGGEF